MPSCNVAEMASCNLIEMVYNKWLQASGKNGGDFYVTTVDDYVRAFMQVVAYYQYLRKSVGSIGLDEEELRLKNAQRHAKVITDPKVFKEAILDMPRAAKFCTHNSHLKGDECFGSTKQKLDLPLRIDEELHRLDEVNYFHPHILRQITRACMEIASYY